MPARKKKKTKRTSKASDVAVVDIGSNSVRMVIYGLDGKKYKMICEKKAMCRLGRRLVYQRPRLTRKGMGLTLKALRKFNRILKKYDITRVYAIGTAAMRAVAHTRKGRHFHKQAERALGHRIAVISGRKEARLTARGVMASMPQANGICGDLGGGSLELAATHRKRIGPTATLPIGSLTLLSQSGGDPIKIGGLLYMSLHSVKWLGIGKGRAFYAIGGSWRAVARVMMKKRGQKIRTIHGFTLPAALAQRYAAEIALKKPQAFRKMHRKIRFRAESVPVAAAVLDELINRMQPARVVFSGHGVREGVLHSYVRA